MELVMTSLLFLVLILLASFGLRVIEGMERENRLVEAELQASQLYRESLDSRVEQVRRYRHDADGLLRALEQSIGRYPDTSAPGSTVVDQEPNLGFGSGYCQLPLADAAIQSKRRLCADAGISFTHELAPDFAAVGARRGVSESDLCIVLQNLLDNAYEASLEAKAVGVEPAMSLRLSIQGKGDLRITVTNRTASAEPPEFRTRKSNPQLHGVGLQVVNDIARTHGGSFTSDFNPATQILTMAVRL
ncbi:MAG: GHKL domain-containing protein [Coriobacteriia bacterium]|nr:GHKL domain-containing protein [Coriobacteriia bacterium]